jgi:hypothetical protein
MDQPAAACASLVRAAANAGRKQVEFGQSPIGEAHGFEAAQARDIGRQSVAGDLAFGLHDLADPLQEPGIISGDGMHFGDAEALRAAPAPPPAADPASAAPAPPRSPARGAP